MPLQVAGQVGPQTLQDGADVPLRQGRLADVIVSELQGRFYEANYRGALFCGSLPLTSLANAAFTTGTPGPTGTPILGVWNPLSSPVNLVILQATLAITMTALQATGPGPFEWMTSIGNAVVSTGKSPFNRKSLQFVGSQAKDMSGTAMTGQSNALSIAFGSGLAGGSAENVAFLATAAGMQTQMLASTENFDGSLIVPPGGILALMSTITAVAHSALGALLWAEVLL